MSGADPINLAIGIAPKARLDVVNRSFIEEVFEEIGRINFGDKLAAEATVVIWRNRAIEVPMVGEFAYQIEFDSPEKLRQKPEQLSEALYKTLQLGGRDSYGEHQDRTGLQVGRCPGQQ